MSPESGLELIHLLDQFSVDDLPHDAEHRIHHLLPGDALRKGNKLCHGNYRIHKFFDDSNSLHRLPGVQREEKADVQDLRTKATPETDPPNCARSGATDDSIWRQGEETAEKRVPG